MGSDVLSALAIFKADQRREVRRATLMRCVAAFPFWACGYNVSLAVERWSWFWALVAVGCLALGIAALWANAHAERIVMDLRAGHMLRQAVRDACAEGVLAGVQVMVDSHQISDAEVAKEDLDKALGEAFFQVTRTRLASS